MFFFSARNLPVAALPPLKLPLFDEDIVTVCTSRLNPART
jgi:hypothetical protein